MDKFELILFEQLLKAGDNKAAIMLLNKYRDTGDIIAFLQKGQSIDKQTILKHFAFILILLVSTLIAGVYLL